MIGNYTPAVAELLEAMPLAPLGPGRPRSELRGKLEAVTFGPGADRDMVAACRAGLWLAFDFLDEAHAISQELPTVEGSYWHALMHRREPDFSNSKYWFRRVGEHPVFTALNEQAARLAAGASGKAAFLATQASWEPFAFVDLCEASYDAKAAHHDLCRQVQRVEWELLFDWCWRRALAGTIG
jgi:hypothetical protein